MRRLPKFVGNGILVLVFSGLAVLMGEYLVRLFLPQVRPMANLARGLYQSHPRLGYSLTPGFRRDIEANDFHSAVRVNSLGLRDEEIAAEADPGEFRILGLGDSFTLGIHAGNLENTYVKLLQSHLNKATRGNTTGSGDGTASETHARVRVINAGVAGYGTEQEIDWLQWLTPHIQPDAVLFAFYLGNDFTDNAGATRMTVEQGHLMLAASAEPFREYSRPLHRKIRIALHSHSDLYLLIKRRLLHPARNLFRQETETLPPRERALRPPDYFIYDAAFADCMLPAASETISRGIAQTREQLSRLRAWSDQQDVPVLVFAIPAAQQVDLQSRQRWIDRFGLDASRFDWRLPNLRLRIVCEETGLQLVDLTDDLTEASLAGPSAYWERDGHWNGYGHRLAAQFLTEPVQEYLIQNPQVIGSR